MNYLILIIIGYLLGSIPFSFLVPRWLGKIDIRKHGSGNTGTTNVVRTLGLKIGVIAFIGDFLKGALSATIGYLVLGLNGAWLCGGIAVLGHCYSPWLNFKGGKGIATSAGVLAILMPFHLIFLLAIQFMIIFSTKYMSLASITSGLLFPIVTIITKQPQISQIASIGFGIFVVYKHKDNIKRLIKGQENKLSIKK